MQKGFSLVTLRPRRAMEVKMPKETTRYSDADWDRILQGDLDRIFPVDIGEKRGLSTKSQANIVEKTPAQKSKSKAA